MIAFKTIFAIQAIFTCTAVKYIVPVKFKFQYCHLASLQTFRGINSLDAMVVHIYACMHAYTHNRYEIYMTVYSVSKKCVDHNFMIHANVCGTCELLSI